MGTTDWLLWVAGATIIGDVKCSVALFDEVHRLGRAHAKIENIVDQRPTEVPQPDMIHGHSGGKRVAFVDQDLGKFKASAAVLEPHRKRGSQ